jgi:diphosphomevalonate decarboxylase
MKATAIANANIALTKYWGKRDKKLMLPNNGSVSMTCDGMSTKTTVEFSPENERDVFIINGKEISEGKAYDKMTRHLDLIREMGGRQEKARVMTENNFPTAAGLASSASGFAALTLAGSKAAGLSLDMKDLSILARRGSGSASRSIEGGFVEWRRGQEEDGSDSYGIQIASPEHWDFRMIAVITSREAKKVSSRAGMAQTVETCPYYKDWVSTAQEDIDAVKQAIRDRDFTRAGSTSEFNTLKMHATMITTRPPIIYWNDATMRIVHSIMDWRDEGLECYFTMDAGPQVKIMCLEKDVEEITRRVREIQGVEDVVVCKPGDSARLVDEHLF